MKNLCQKTISFVFALCMVLSVFTGAVWAKDNDTIVILYENDVHCAVEGYSKLAAMKNELLENYAHVGVVSCGDFVQGGTLGAVSKGEYIVNLMNKVGYDAIALGNHEFDYHLSRLLELNEMSNTKFLSCNFAKIGEEKSFFDSYTIVSYGDVDVAYIGITTPETINSSSPAQFKNDDGEMIYTFHEANLFEIVQETIDDAKAAGADYVIALSHIGYAESGDWSDITDVIENTE
ncbi:MAG: bifunctional metallophosphatase/5'-nucleotidase, partial [Oscillospiraceae bacterium]|nr:bifunctional metallophosphatase/5'-nucleotidase [Oscillospiraceae bacterium]